MKNKYAIILSYVFIIICSVFLMNFQIATVNQMHLGQNFEGDGFVDEAGNQKDPLDIGPSNEEFHRMILRYAPYAGIGIVVILVLVIFRQRTKLRTFEKPGLIRIENENAMVESDISQLIPHYDKDKFIDARYNDFVEIKRAYLTNNIFKLKKKLTDQLLNQYVQEIEGFKARGQVHTLKDSRYRGAIIKNIEQVNTMLILTLELKVCYFEYVEQNNQLISGNRDKKVIVYYELRFITDLRDFISVCPHCGAKSPDTFAHVCEYCAEEVEETGLNWKLNQENIIIKSYGEDI